MEMEPVTREEMYLAKAGGQNVETPEPITRKERFLDAIARKAGGGTSAPSDWNAAEGEPGHVLNRTHYKEGGVLEKRLIAAANDVSLTPNEMLMGLPFGIVRDDAYIKKLEAGKKYAVNWADSASSDDTLYTCTAENVEFNGETAVAIGNVSLAMGGESTGEPFIIFIEDSGLMGLVSVDGLTSVDVRIYEEGIPAYHPLEAGYLPEKFEAGWDFDSELENPMKRIIFKSYLDKGIPIAYNDHQLLLLAGTDEHMLNGIYTAVYTDYAGICFDIHTNGAMSKKFHFNKNGWVTMPGDNTGTIDRNTYRFSIKTGLPMVKAPDNATNWSPEYFFIGSERYRFTVDENGFVKAIRDASPMEEA